MNLSTPFFEFGADSLHMMKVANKLTERPQRSIRPTALFEHHNIRELARYLNSTVSEQDAFRQRIMRRTRNRI